MGARPMPKDLAIARAVREAVRRVADVADLSPGRFGEAVTYGPGDRVPGVVVRHDADALHLEVHVVAVYRDSLFLPALADEVRRAVQEQAKAVGAGPVQRVDVAIDDLRMDGGGERR